MFYYLIKGGQQIGPLTKEELQLSRISISTMVWHEGLSSWTEAKNIIDLKDILVPLPPPIPPPIGGQIPKEPIIDSGDDENYRKENEAIMVGIAGFGVQLLVFSMYLVGERLDEISLFLLFLSSIFYRIIAIIWTLTISKKQNRDTLSWGILGFLFPSIALIIISQTKRLLKLR